MKKSTTSFIVSGATTVVLAGLVVASLSGCTTVADPVATDTVASTDANVKAPLVVTIDQVQGQMVALVTGDFLDINVADGTEADWKAVVTDEKVAQFIPGGPDGSAVMNPGFAALNPGTTDVVMTGAGQTVDFSITVTTK